MNDDLSNLLKSWDPAAPAPAAFKRGVWRRIETGGAGKISAVGMWWKEFLGSLARPRVAFATVALAMLAGAWIGHTTANPDGQQAYLRSVNPYAHVAAVSDS